jgi:hypothetical protein
MDRQTNEVNTELRDLAPHLAKLPKKNTSVLPNGYFQEVEEQIMRQILIAEIDDKSPAQAPDGYFEKLESDLDGMVNKSNANNSSGIKMLLLSNLKLIRYAAAAVMILFVSVWVVFNMNSTNDEINNIAMDNSDGYLEYLEDNLDDYDINTLVDHGLVEESDITLITYTGETYADETQDVYMETSIDF